MFVFLRIRPGRLLVLGIAGMLLLSTARDIDAEEALSRKWLMATAYAVPKETVTDGEGYFSIIEGHNRRLYIGTHANGVNSWLVEFDPMNESMRLAVDAHEVIGTDLKGFGAQAKIHTRNNVGKKTGHIYFGTKQGYPATDGSEGREDYPGGYPMVYNPETESTKVYPIPVPHEGINSIAPDESRGLAYISTCSDHRPGPKENAIFLILDLKSGKYRELMDTEYSYGFIVIDWLGRAYHPVLGGEIARYDPRTDKLERLTQTIDGEEPKEDMRLTMSSARHDPINWDISPDGKTLYAQPMNVNSLFAYDLTGEGDVLRGRYLGDLVPGAASIDCRAMCVGPSGIAWCAVTEIVDGMNLLHLVRYAPGDKAPVDLGPVAITNPNFTEFKDKDGKLLPYHDGFIKHPDGVTSTRVVVLGVCESRDGHVNIMALHPYSLLRVSPDQLR